MRIEFASAWNLRPCMWIMGTSTPGNILRASQRTMLEDDKDQNQPSKIRCPDVVTGAADTIYADSALSTLRIMKGLADLLETREELWIPETPGERNLMAKGGAWDTSFIRMVNILDQQMALDRA